MSQKISELFEESVEKVLLEGELDIASTVQQTLIPPIFYEGDGLEVHSYYQAASRCGGDWWGIFRVRNRVCIAIGDATGHGLPSALITAGARSCLSMLHRMAERNPAFSYSPNEMLGLQPGRLRLVAGQDHDDPVHRGDRSREAHADLRQ